MKITCAILSLMVFATNAATRKEEKISSIIHNIVKAVEDAGMMPQRRLTATTKSGRRARGTLTAKNGAEATRRLKKSGFFLGGKGKGEPDNCCEFIAGLFQLEAACFAAYQAADLEAICELPAIDGSLSGSSKGSNPVNEYRDAQDAFFDFLDDFGLDEDGPELIDKCNLSGPIASDTTPETDEFFLLNSFSFLGYCLGGGDFFTNDDQINLFGADVDDLEYDMKEARRFFN